MRAIISLWRGLNAGLAYQVVMNGTRLTLFDFMKDHGDGFKLNQMFIDYFINSKQYLNSISVPISIAGVSAGALSGSVASPFYMLKTQQQSLSSIQVGNQHSESNTGMFRFFKSQVEKGGITGKVLHSIKWWKLVWLILYESYIIWDYMMVYSEYMI